MYFFSAPATLLNPCSFMTLTNSFIPMVTEPTVAAVFGSMEFRLLTCKLPKPVKIKATQAKIMTIPKTSDFVFTEENIRVPRRIIL